MRRNTIRTAVLTPFYPIDLISQWAILVFNHWAPGTSEIAYKTVLELWWYLMNSDIASARRGNVCRNFSWPHGIGWLQEIGFPVLTVHRLKRLIVMLNRSV
ncbi:hypothetical protein CTT34_02175 [Vreelandella aquamarina]|uniref:Uncharacterized protein n=1 Tax=Vreelandella aquamarina TaxID=77097 RepID=A0A857GH61_9GAMM|nr:hypothetical protein CTT34_02175 [Halomonas meridiana]